MVPLSLVDSSVIILHYATSMSNKQLFSIQEKFTLVEVPCEIDIEEVVVISRVVRGVAWCYITRVNYCSWVDPSIRGNRELREFPPVCYNLLRL